MEEFQSELGRHGAAKGCCSAKPAARAVGCQPMQPNFQRYRAIGQRFVTGFLEPETLSVLDVLNAAQRTQAGFGCGRRDRRPPRQAVHRLEPAPAARRRSRWRSTSSVTRSSTSMAPGMAISRSSRTTSSCGRRWTTWSCTRAIRRSSQPAKLRELAGGAIRFFSVDGGHTDEIVFSDMKLAEATLADGGIVIADDVFNEQWPGVAVGTLRYLVRRGQADTVLDRLQQGLLHPAGVLRLLSRRGGVGARRQACGWRRLPSVFAGHEVAIDAAAQGAKGHSAARARRPVAVSPHVPRDGPGACSWCPAAEGKVTGE